MTYSAIAKAARDQHLRSRIAACLAQEGGLDEHPIPAADAIIWACCAQPGWGEAWAYALATEVADPGDDPAVISDGMILSAVQSIRALALA